MSTSKTSAGLLMYRFQDPPAGEAGKTLEVFLGHPGGPLYTKRDTGVWGIPKGETDGSYDLFATAKREFAEETGITPRPDSQFIDLGSLVYPSGKQVFVWAFEDGTFDPSRLTSNNFTMEWPPKSGRIQEFPEIDRGDYFSLPQAREKIFKPQEPFLDRLEKALKT